MRQKSFDEIARVAYDLWEKGGRQNGKELENRTAAEQVVMEQNKSECGGSKRRDEIRKIAYEVREKEGKPASQDLDNWLEGKRILRRTVRDRRFPGPWMMRHGDSSKRPPNGNDDNKKGEEAARDNG